MFEDLTFSPVSQTIPTGLLRHGVLMIVTIKYDMSGNLIGKAFFGETFDQSVSINVDNM